MNIFISEDTFNETAVKTKKELIRKCLSLNINVSDCADNADVIISIGGDGTFLKSSKLSYNTPVIGINCGTVGYLTEIRPEDITEALLNIKKGNYYIEERMMIKGEILKENGDVIKIPQALNEISVSKNNFGVVRFDVFINDKLINSYTADGILVSTPTGSTAYNLSCGGPIVEPTANIITLTPIAPHSIINRSIVLSDDSEVKIKIKELRENHAYVLSDGKAFEISSGDIITVKKSKYITKIIKLNWRSFVDTVRDNIS